MGGSRNQTTTQNTTPWAGQQPYLTDLFGSAQGLYGQGPEQYFPNETVSPFSPQTQQGLDMATNQALNPGAYQDAFGGYLTGTMGTPNLNPYSIASGGYEAMGGLGQGMNMLSRAGRPQSYGAAAGMAGVGMNGVNPMASRQLAGTAGGGFLGSNPYLDSVYDSAASRLTNNFNESVLPGIAGMFGAAGRSNSGIQALATGRAASGLTDSLASLGADIYAPAYESERDRMLQAAGSLGQLGLGGGEQDIARRGLASDIYTGGLDRQLAAGSQLGNFGLGGLEGLTGLYSDIGQQQFRAGSLAPSYQQMQFGNVDRLLGVGGTIEDQVQRLIDSDMQRWQFGQQAPWNSLNNYSNIIYGLPGGYGTTVGTQPRPSRLQGAAGGAMAGAALGPWGALGGAVLGGLL